MVLNCLIRDGFKLSGQTWLCQPNGEHGRADVQTYGGLGYNTAVYLKVGLGL